MSLDKANTGYAGIIKNISGNFQTVLRLYDLGFVPGEPVSIQSKFLSGDPIVVEVRGTSIALRAHEAGCVQV
jgi:Fe2+ transport system protein FeoA